LGAIKAEVGTEDGVESGAIVLAGVDELAAELGVFEMFLERSEDAGGGGGTEGEVAGVERVLHG
jgi:hypothetical protein